MALTTLNLRAFNRSDTASSGQVVTATSATAMDFQDSAGFDVTSITGATALSAIPATTDEFVMSDGGVLKRIDSEYVMSPLFSGARVTHSSTQSVAQNTDVFVAFNTEQYDTDSWHDNSTNNSRLTVPTLSGNRAVNYVAISAHVFFNNIDDAKYAEMRIAQGGAMNTANSRQVASVYKSTNTGGMPLGGATIASCSAGDYFQVCVATSDSDAELETGNNGSAVGYFLSFEIARIG